MAEAECKEILEMGLSADVAIVLLKEHGLTGEEAEEIVSTTLNQQPQPDRVLAL